MAALEKKSKVAGQADGAEVSCLSSELLSQARCHLVN